MDLDSLKWWADFAHKCVTSFGIIGLGIWHWILWLKEKEEAISWMDHHIERRHTMGIIDEIKLLVGVVPKIEQIVADAKATEQTPQTQKLIADIEAEIAVFKQAMSASAQVPPAPAAPPAGQV